MIGYRAFVGLALAVVALQDAAAQGAERPRAARAGRRAPLPVAEEIALARSAAPASISGRARVLMLTDTGYVVVADDSSDVTCVVNRSWSLSLEPHCYDPEGAATVMRLELRRNFLRHRGTPEPEIAKELAAGLRDGSYRLPSRPALTYMMSGSQVLYDDEGRYVGRWRPHLMIYFPNLTGAKLGLPPAPEMRVGMVADAGDAESSLMIVVPAFVEPDRARP